MPKKHKPKSKPKTNINKNIRIPSQPSIRTTIDPKIDNDQVPQSPSILHTDIEKVLNSNLNGNKKKMGNVFALEDGLALMRLGGAAIIQDEFSKCFQPQPPIPFREMLSPEYLYGIIYRYCILFTYRLILLLWATYIFLCCLPFVLLSNVEKLKRLLFLFFCKAILKAFSSKIKYHGQKPKLHKPHVFVANHTSFVDYIILSGDQFPLAVISQVHGGILGFIQKNILSLNGSVTFQRKDKSARGTVAQKAREHVHRPSSSPLLIFPEGTCVNNEYTVLFQKGAFDMDCTICPVAIKYDKSKLDPYWNTRKQTFTKHFLYIMTRWSLEADVWYLPPMQKLPGETAIDFANRVKALISKTANLTNLSVDGYFKNVISITNEQELKLQEPVKSSFYRTLINRIKRSNATIHKPPQIVDELGGPLRAHLRKSKSVMEFGFQELSRLDRAGDIDKMMRPNRNRMSTKEGNRRPNSQSTQSSSLSFVPNIPNSLLAAPTVPVSTPMKSNNRPSLPRKLSHSDIDIAYDLHKQKLLSSPISTLSATEVYQSYKNGDAASGLNLQMDVAQTQEELVNTWKMYSKEHQDSLALSERRIENLSWRIWFREFLRYQRLHSPSPVNNSSNPGSSQSQSPQNLNKFNFNLHPNITEMKQMVGSLVKDTLKI